MSGEEESIKKLEILEFDMPTKIKVMRWMLHVFNSECTLDFLFLVLALVLVVVGRRLD